MVISIGPELEAALGEVARRQGIAPEMLAVNVLQARFLTAAALQPPGRVGARSARGSARLWRVPTRLGPEPRRVIRLMAYLNDTTVLARLANAADAQHAVAARAVLELHRRGELLNVTPQVMIEFRNVATRPLAVNGLGLSIVDAEAQAATFERDSLCCLTRRTFTRPGRPW